MTGPARIRLDDDPLIVGEQVPHGGPVEADALGVAGGDHDAKQVSAVEIGEPDEQLDGRANHSDTAGYGRCTPSKNPTSGGSESQSMAECSAARRKGTARA